MKQEHWTWLRDKFGRWFASTTSFTFMWFAIGLAVAVAYFWDAIWSGRQAPEGLELSFQAGGAVVRTWTVFALVGVVALFRSKAHWLGGILLATWLCTSVMSYGHVLGFVASGQMERYAGGTAVEQKLDIKTDTKAAAIERLEGQLAAVDSDLSSAVAVLDAEIKQYITDGRDNDDLADESRARRGKLQDDAAAEKRKLNAEIIALMTAAADTKVAAQDEGVTAVKFDPLYMWIASALHGPEPSTDQLKTVAARVGAFWAFLIEMIAGAGPAILYAAHAHFADRSEAKDPKRVEAGKKAWETRKKNEPLPIDDEGYWESRIAKALKTRMKKPNAEGMANTYFGSMSVPELTGHLNLRVKRGQLEPNDRDFILRLGEYAPEEQLSNGRDLTIIGDADADDSQSDQLSS